MPPKRKHGKDLPPNLYPATDTRDGVTRYRYRDPRTGKFHGMGTDKAAAVADALALNAAIYAGMASRVASITSIVSDTPKLSAVILKHYAAHPEYVRINNHNRRARKREAGGRLSTRLSAKLFRLQRGKCACCGKPLGTDYHLDHIMPLALGGTNTDDNIQLLRAECNLQKHAKHPIDFMRQRGFLL